MIHYFSLWETVLPLYSFMGCSPAAFGGPSAKGYYLSPRTDQNASAEKPDPGSLGIQLFTSTSLQVSHTGEAGAQSRHLLVQSCMLLLAWHLSKTFKIPPLMHFSGLPTLKIMIGILIATQVMRSDVYLYHSYHLIPLNLQCCFS